MGDTIFSVRIDENTKNSFTNMAKEAGINNKEFMEQLISLYNLNKVSMASSINTESDITELQNISRRMVDIFVNLISRMDTIVSECDKKNTCVLEQCEKLKENHEQVLEEKEKEKEKLKSRIEEVIEENEKLKKYIDDSEEANSNMKSLNKMQEEKLRELQEKILHKDKQIQDMNDLKNQYDTLKNDNEQMKNIMENYKVNMEGLQKKVSTLEKDNESIECNVKKDYENKMSMMNERLEIEKSREILKLKEDKYNEVHMLQKEYGEKILYLTEQHRLCQETIKKMQEKTK